MLIVARLPFPPAEGEYMTAGFMVGFSQWGADLLPGQSTSVKTASACTHMHSTHQRKKKKKKSKERQAGPTKLDDKVHLGCNRKKKLNI